MPTAKGGRGGGGERARPCGESLAGGRDRRAMATVHSGRKEGVGCGSGGEGLASAQRGILREGGRAPGSDEPFDSGLLQVQGCQYWCVGWGLGVLWLGGLAVFGPEATRAANGVRVVAVP